MTSIYGGTPPAEVIDFLNRVFIKEKGRTGDIRRSFPHVFNRNMRSFFIVERGQNKILGNVTLKEIVFDKFKLGMVGFVSTAREERGKGIATALLKEAEKLCHKREIPMVFLWTSKQELYKKIGWTQKNLFPERIIQNKQLKKSTPDISIKRSKNPSPFFALYKKYHSFHFRTAQRFKEIFNADEHMHFGKIEKFLFTKNEKPTGYFFMSEGTERILEFVSRQDDVKDTLYALTCFTRKDKFSCPVYARGKISLPQIKDTLTMVKICNPVFKTREMYNLKLFPLDKM